MHVALIAGAGMGKLHGEIAGAEWGKKFGYNAGLACIMSKWIKSNDRDIEILGS